MAAPPRPAARFHEGRTRRAWRRVVSTGSPNMAFCPLSLFAGVHFCYVEISACAVADIAAFTELRIGLRHRVRERGERQVARRAGRCCGRHGADPSLRIQHVVLANGEDGFRTGDVAHVALGRVGDSTGGRHRGITHFAEVVVASAESDDGVVLAGRRQAFAGVDLVDHQGKVDGLVGLGLVGRVGGDNTASAIVLAGVVAEHAHLDLVTVFAVQRKIVVAAVALVDVHYMAARGHLGTVHREVDHLINGAVFAGLLLCRTCQQRTAPAPFDADGIRAGGVGRNRVLKRIGTGAVVSALGGRYRVLRYVARRGDIGTETGVAVVRRGTGHYQGHAVAAAGQLSHRYRVTGVVLRGEGDGGSVAGDAVVHLNDIEHETEVGERLGGNRVRAYNGRVELQFALRNVALRALVVGDLRQVDALCGGGC